MFRSHALHIASFATILLLTLIASPATAQCPAFICYVDLVNGSAVCPNSSVYMNSDGSGPITGSDFDDISGSCSSIPNAIALRVDLPEGCTGLEVITDFGSDPEGHLFNLGDSISNDGFGGDAGSLPAGENAEVHLIDQRLLVFSAANNPDDVDQLADSRLQLDEGALKFVVDDQFVCWGNPYTALETPDLERLFFLGDNPDNRTLYVAANRVVANTSRIGCGVRHLLMYTR